MAPMGANSTLQKNPFRTLAVTPPSTGTAASGSSTAATAVEPRPTPETTTSTPPPPEPVGRSNRHGVLDIPDEEPPAYTPSADVYHGEETLEYGPRRPFQNAVRPRPEHAPLSHSTPHTTPARPEATVSSIWRQLSRQIDQVAAQLTGPSSSSTGRAPPSWAGYPGAHHTQLGPIYAPPPGPPPLSTPSHNSLAPPLPPRRASISGPSPSASEFARDFYAAGTGPNEGDEHLLDSRPQSMPQSSPPLGRSSHTRSSSTGAAERPRGNDKRPTPTPTPGHPLLRDGKLLVYPGGYKCQKCKNIGFKHADPSHPCKKCWSKYAKPFTGPLAYALSSNTPFEDGQSTFQQPLPDLRPPRPQAYRAPPPPPAPIPVPTLQPPRPPQPFPGAFHGSGPVFHTVSPYSLTRAGPGDGITLRAGDPRLGGRLCWRCEGTGTVSFLLFDESDCDVCGGIGRVF